MTQEWFESADFEKTANNEKKITHLTQSFPKKS